MDETAPPPADSIPNPDSHPTSDSQHIPGSQQSSDSQPSAHSGRPSGSTSGLDRFFTWIRETGIVRSNERWFAGVAGGIAAKSGIDPLIIRGIFVVLAILGGPGILLYLAGWLLLPDLTGRIHLEELFRGRASAGVIAWSVILGTLVVLPLLVGVVSGGFGGGLWGWNVFNVFPQWAQITMAVIWWALIVPAGVVWLIIWLQRNRPHTAAAAAAAAGNTADGSAHFTAGSAAGHTASPTEAAVTETAADAAFANAYSDSDATTAQSPSWSEKATAWGEKTGKTASAWGESLGRDTAARAKALHEARRLGAGHVVLTLAVALIAAACAALWASSAKALSSSPIPGDSDGALLFAIIAALAVCAISLIIVGIRGRNSGWIGFIAFCGIIALIFTSVLPWGSRVQPFGNVELTITGVSDPAGLTVLAGNAIVDLSDLEEQHDLSIWVLAGNATVTMPDSMPAVVKVVVGAGNIRDQRDANSTVKQSGPFLARTVGANLDGVAADKVSHITVHVFAGNVNITGANAGPNLADRFVDESQPTMPRSQDVANDLILENAA